MSFKTRVLFSTIICVLLSYSIFFFCLDFFSMNRSFYNYEYTKLHTAYSIGISNDALIEATDTLLDYIQDHRDDIKVVVEIKGEEREVFNERETIHMVDVKNLYQNALLIRNVSLLVVVGLLLLLIVDYKEGVVEVLTYTYKRFFITFAFFMSALCVFAFCNFRSFWLLFHKVLFTNNYYFLDPATSIMIRMFPEQFFSTLVFCIVGSYLLILLLFWFYSLYDEKKRLKG